MADEKLANLIMRLERGTEMRKVPWESTATDNLFQATLSGYIVQIQQIPCRDDSPDYSLRLLNKDGQVIDEASHVEVNQTALFRESRNAYSVMKSIFDLARRTALGGDQAIDDIISQL